MSCKIVPDFAEILGVLTPREEQILRMRLGLVDPRDLFPMRTKLRQRRRMTLKEVGEQFAVGKERIRQIQNRAMEKLEGMARR